MNKSTKIIIAITSCLAIITTIGACSRGHWGNHGYSDPVKKVEWIKEEIDDHLDLTEVQSAELDRLGDSLLNIHKERKQNRQAKTELIRDLIAAPTMDQTGVLELVNDHTRFVDKKAPEVIAAIARFSDTLSVEQKSEITEHVDRWVKHHAE